MSSWIFDWERSILPAAKLRPEVRERGKYRTHCKLGRHPVMELDPARWVTDSRLAPLGISCLPCLQEKATELGVALPVEPEAPAKPAARKGPGGRPAIPEDQWVHGKASTYIKRKCRCVPCTEANSQRSLEYRARRAARA